MTPLWVQQGCQAFLLNAWFTPSVMPNRIAIFCRLHMNSHCIGEHKLKTTPFRFENHTRCGPAFTHTHTHTQNNKQDKKKQKKKTKKQEQNIQTTEIFCRVTHPVAASWLTFSYEVLKSCPPEFCKTETTPVLAGKASMDFRLLVLEVWVALHSADLPPPNRGVTAGSSRPSFTKIREKLEMLSRIVSCLASPRKILGEIFFEYSGWHKTSRNA